TQLNAAHRLNVRCGALQTRDRYDVWRSRISRAPLTRCTASGAQSSSMAQRNSPPLRADPVGRLLRPPPPQSPAAQRQTGKISARKLKAVEDREISAIIKKQEETGLQAVTDGEFRRAFWNYDFLGALPGVEAYLGERKIKFKGPNPRPMMLRVTRK